MRRQDRKLSDDETKEVLRIAEYGVLSTVTPDGEPYGTPFSYAYDEQKNALFMHCSADGGQKIDNIRAHPHVCFSVVADTQILPEKFTTLFRSAMVFGVIEIIDDTEQKRYGLRRLVEKYSPGLELEGEKNIRGSERRTYILKLNIEECTGKAKKRKIPSSAKSEPSS